MITFLDISLLNCCTYRCSYCISNTTKATSRNYRHAVGEGSTFIHQNNGPTLKPHVLANWIFGSFSPFETIVQLSGGEPLLHDSIVQLVESIRGQGYTLVINSNGNQIDTLLPETDIDKWDVYWRFSWHPEQRSLKAFLEDIKAIDRERVLVNYVAHPAKIETREVFNEIAELEESGYKFEVTAFTGKWNEVEYDKHSPVYEGIATMGKEKTVAPLAEARYLSVQAGGEVKICHKHPVGNIYDRTMTGTRASNAAQCKMPNGYTSCGLMQSCYLLGVPLLKGPEQCR